MGDEETRAHPRFAVEVDAEVRLVDRVIPARTRNVSRGGICFVTREAIPLGTEVVLNMALVFDEQTFSEPLLVRSRIVWCTDLGGGRWQVGTTFFGLTQDNRAYLDMFLRYLRAGQERQAAEEAARRGGRDDDDTFG